MFRKNCIILKHGSGWEENGISFKCMLLLRLIFSMLCTKLVISVHRVDAYLFPHFFTGGLILGGSVCLLLNHIQFYKMYRVIKLHYMNRKKMYNTEEVVTIAVDKRSLKSDTKML